MSHKPAPKEPMKKITLTLSDELHRDIKAAAAKYGVSMSALIRCILVLFILRDFETDPTLLKKGTSVASWREKWHQYIIPEVEAEMMPPKTKGKKRAKEKPTAKKKPITTAAKKSKKASARL